MRGATSFSQISPIDPLIRMQPGIWGINERDVPIAREGQQRLVERLVQGRYVYLAEWERPRRETIGHAVSAVLEDAAGPLTRDEIAASVENRIGRKIGKPVISGALQALEAEFSDTTREWSLSRPLTDDDEDAAGPGDDDSVDMRRVSLWLSGSKRIVESSGGKTCSGSRRLRKQSINEALVQFDQVGLCSVVFSHSPDDLAGNPHSHVFQIPVVAHHVFQ